jgi:hypothetical protein
LGGSSVADTGNGDGGSSTYFEDGASPSDTGNTDDGLALGGAGWRGGQVVNDWGASWGCGSQGGAGGGSSWASLSGQLSSAQFTSSTSPLAQITFFLAPVISSIAPNSGPTTGGTSITIAGTSLLNATVAIGASACAVTSDTSSFFTCTTPSGTAGQATVTVQTASGSGVGSFTYEGPQPSGYIDVTANIRSYSSVGTIIGYSIYIENGGNVPLSGISATQSLSGAGPSCQSTTLSVGAAESCSSSYVITQADLSAGSLSNTVMVTAYGPSGPPLDAQQTVTVPAAVTSVQLVAGSPSIALGTPLAGTVNWSDPFSGSLQLIYALIGPIAPVNGSCQGLNWTNASTDFSAAPLLGTGLSQSMNAQAYTPTARGCYSYAGFVFDSAGAFNIAPGGTGEITLVQ